MKYNEIGFDLSNLQYGIIKQKNGMLGMFLLIFGGIFFAVAIPFVIIWALGVPMEINGVMRESTDPEYISFMGMMLSVFGLIGLISLIASYFSYKAKATDYIKLGKDSNLDDFFSVRISPNQDLYIYQKLAIYHNKITDDCMKVTDIQTIEEMRDRYIFWLRWPDLRDYKTVKKNKKTILSFKDQSGRIVLSYKYVFYLTSNLIPEKISETVYSSSSNQRSFQSYRIYYFTDINRMGNIKVPQVVENAKEF